MGHDLHPDPDKECDTCGRDADAILDFEDQTLCIDCFREAVKE